MKRKRNNISIEARIYEFLGVKQFRKLTFLLEKFIHRKDKGKNINYHIERYDIDQLEKFKKHLYRNGYIHLRNSIGNIVVSVLSVCFFNNIILLYTIPALIKNLYCVMLQRYNYIRIDTAIKKHKDRLIKKYETKSESIIETNIHKEVKNKEPEKNIEQINELKKFLQGKEDLVINDNYKETLLLLKEYLLSQDNNKINEENIKRRKKIKQGGIENER